MVYRVYKVTHKADFTYKYVSIIDENDADMLGYILQSKSQYKGKKESTAKQKLYERIRNHGINDFKIFIYKKKFLTEDEARAYQKKVLQK